MKDDSEALKGRRVLIVEDEFVLAYDLQALLVSEGCTVIGIVPSVAKALNLLDDQQPDVATLDLNLRGHSSQPVANALRQRGIPFIALSGYTTFARDFDLQDAPFVKKPIDPAELMEKLRSLLT
jgi:CheY-like chemotaxis protein